MKSKFYVVTIIVIIGFCGKVNAQTNTFPANGAAGIGTTTPNSSSLLEVVSTSKGVLIPRMTQTQRDVISAPATGLLIYQTNKTPGFYYYDGSKWTAVSPKGVNKSLSNLMAPTAVNADLLPDANTTWNLGSPTTTWANLYLGGTVWIGTHKFLSQNTGTGAGNTSAGIDAYNVGSTGSYNTAVGHQALYSTTTGYSNVALGASALKNNTSGFQMVAVGDSALFNQAVNSQGYYENTALGTKALFSNTNGVGNTATGISALYSNSTGWENTANGDGALFSNTTASANSAFGFESLFYNTTGFRNTAMGGFALFDNGSGSDNTAIGDDALENNQTGSSNTAVGSLAMAQRTSGYSNVAIGVRTLIYSNENNLVAVGDSSLYWNGFNVASGSGLVAVGSKTLFNNTSGSANSAFGYRSLYLNTTGGDNTAVGYFAGDNVTTGSDNTFLGYNANSGVAGTLTNSTAIGSGATVTSPNNFVFGNSSVVKWGFGQTAAAGNIIDFVNTTAKLTTGGVWTNASDRKLKNNFQKLDRQDILEKISKLDIERWHYIKDDNDKITHIGPVAQDFYEAFKVGDDTTISTIDPAGVALLGIQQLKKENDDLKTEVDQLKTMIIAMQQQYASCNPCMQSSQQSAMSNESSVMSSASLQQNIPNPFNHTTTINYTLPQQYSSAKMIVTDKSGKVLKETNLSGSIRGSLTVDASTLSSGAYHYSLYVDGKLIETKQLIVAK